MQEHMRKTTQLHPDDDLSVRLWLENAQRKVGENSPDAQVLYTHIPTDPTKFVISFFTAWQKESADAFYEVPFIIEYYLLAQ